jgi:hypothetical protein
MGKVKELWIQELEKSADQLEAITGPEELPKPPDYEGMKRIQNDKNFKAKRKLIIIWQMIRKHAENLRTGKGFPLRPENAQENIDSLEQNASA